MDKIEQKEIIVSTNPDIREPIIKHSPPLEDWEIQSVFRNELYTINDGRYFYNSNNKRKGKRNR